VIAARGRFDLKGDDNERPRWQADIHTRSITKRVRKFLGHIKEVDEMPNLIEVQKASRPVPDGRGTHGAARLAKA